MHRRCALRSCGCATTARCAPASAPTRAPPCRPTPTTPGRTGWRAPSPPRRAASVNSPMRRTILMALLAALLLACPALADGPRVKILRDCQDDGVLQGDYTAAQMRD